MRHVPRPKLRYHPNMRILTLFAIAATPVHAWEFTPTPICTLSHVEAAAQVEVTYDHTTRLYAIAVTSAGGWPSAPAFSIRFDGEQPGTISTTRHQTNQDTLTVSDVGFGNVLDGLEFNSTATAFTQTAAVTVSLTGAAPEVQKFRACVSAPVA